MKTLKVKMKESLEELLCNSSSCNLPGKDNLLLMKLILISLWLKNLSQIVIIRGKELILDVILEILTWQQRQRKVKDKLFLIFLKYKCIPYQMPIATTPWLSINLNLLLKINQSVIISNLLHTKNSRLQPFLSQLLTRT